MRRAGREVVPLFRGHAHTEHDALDALAGVAAGECGGLTYLSFFSFHALAILTLIHGWTDHGALVTAMEPATLALFHPDIVSR